MARRRKQRNYRTPVVVQYLDTEGTSDFKTPTSEWKEAFTDRADFENIKPDEQIVAQQVHGGATSKAVCRWSKRWDDLQRQNAQVRLVVYGVVWAVTATINHEMESREVVLMVERTAEVVK